MRDRIPRFEYLVIEYIFLCNLLVSQKSLIPELDSEYTKEE